jgi:hypothetical protein
MKPKLIKAEPVGNTMLELSYSDGLLARVDFAPTLWGEICAPLHSPDYFARVKVEDNTVVWPNEFDICPDVLRFWAEKGRVTSKEETDAHFAKKWATADFQLV